MLLVCGSRNDRFHSCWNMDRRLLCRFIVIILVLNLILDSGTALVSKEEKETLRLKVLEMFNHAYTNYMDNAYPADELMPLSCKGRFRGSEPSRGDIDDSLGNFTLTLVDTLDTLAVLGQYDEFDKAVRLVIRDVKFDTDVVVSVFETNIRVLGGLLGGHFLAKYLKRRKKAMHWYNDELVAMARDLGDRLLPAFNTTTGVPFPRVNLRYGVNRETSGTGTEKDTCTACAGTMILEFAALSRITGDPKYEEKAKKTLEFLWKQRHRTSDLVGTVINIHNGDWVRRESGVGAGIDSYYEYLLKAYILLGDETYLDRFNKHYESIMRYISQGPMLVDVHMHKPLTNSRHFMDSLHAFWPGLQILKGDIKPAIEIHEMLYQVTQRHHFLPEAFTTDFRIHWGQHPLRPEFVESTYFIYKATGDPYYLEVGKTVLNNLETHARVPCGFASIKDVSTLQHEDQMDSYVLAETFKYLYLLFSESDDMAVKVDDFIFTTEGHLIPLSISLDGNTSTTSKNPAENIGTFEKATVSDLDEDNNGRNYDRTCPNTHYLFPSSNNYAHTVRSPLKDMVKNLCPKPKASNVQRSRRLRADEFISGNSEHLEDLRRMGIKIVTMNDGRVQLLHTASEALSSQDAEEGMLFMQEMIALSQKQNKEVVHDTRVVQLISHPYFGNEVLNAGPAQFGYNLKDNAPMIGELIASDPQKGCGNLKNRDLFKDKIVVMERGDCMFIDKARNIQAAGGLGGIIIDNNPESSEHTSTFFAMSGDGKTDVQIPMLFLFSVEGRRLQLAMSENEVVKVRMADKKETSDNVVRQMMAEQNKQMSSSDEKAESRIINIEFGNTRLKFQTVDTSLNEKSLLQIIEGPGNTKELSFQLEKFITSPGESSLSNVYDELMKLLEQQTNFRSLDRKEIYTKALNKLVQTTFSTQRETPDTITQSILDELTKMLQPAEETVTESNPADGHYATTEELLDASADQSRDEAAESESESGSDQQRDVIIDQQTGVRYMAEGPKSAARKCQHRHKPNYDANMAHLWANKEKVRATITVGTVEEEEGESQEGGGINIQTNAGSHKHTEITLNQNKQPGDGEKNTHAQDSHIDANNNHQDKHNQNERTSDAQNEESRQKHIHPDDEL